MPIDGITRQLARYVVRTEFGRLPRDAVAKAKTCVLDWIGCAFAGSQTRTSQIFTDLAGEMGRSADATVVGGGKTSCLAAALVNGAISHELEFDDVHRASISHPGAPVIPAALATAERTQADGATLLAAVVVGYDVSLRIGEAVNPSHYRFWHTTGTCGTFGAAAAAGKVLGLDEEQMVNALGNAGSQAAGLWEFVVDGAMTKVLHTGKAAMNGTLSALLAARGFTGAKRILEGERGFCNATSQDYDLDKITAGLGSNYKILEVGLKAYPCCGHTHTAISAALELRRSARLQPEAIRAVTVRTYGAAIKVAGKSAPRSPREAKFSLPYCTAAALRFGKVGLDQFTPEALEDETVRRLLLHTTLREDPELDKEYPALYPAVIEIETDDGRRHSLRVDFAPGDPELPMTDQQRVGKFGDLAGGTVGDVRRKALVERISGLELVPDIEEVASLLCMPC